MYNTAATIRQGAKTDTDAKVLKAKLSLNWTPLTPRMAPPWALSSYIWICPPTSPA